MSKKSILILLPLFPQQDPKNPAARRIISKLTPKELFLANLTTSHLNSRKIFILVFQGNTLAISPFSKIHPLHALQTHMHTEITIIFLAVLFINRGENKGLPGT